MIRLQPTKEFKLPITAECITPDVFQAMSLNEIGMQKIWEGNKQKRLDELFKIDNSKDTTASESTMISISGDVSKVKRIGAQMKNGGITINGNVGMHLGEEMAGGKITVNGDVGSWAGSMMKNGAIEIHGNAGDYLAAPYRGSTKGMHGGKITVNGNVGNEAGAHMKRGTIKILGNTGQFVGLRMHDGTIQVQGDCDARAGACMIAGKIVIEGKLESILPSFTVDTIKPKVKIEENETVQGPFYVFLGDLAECGNGKLYVSKQNNPQMIIYDKFL
jgi:formylmethanofuran dehydrogenase subunit C